MRNFDPPEHPVELEERSPSPSEQWANDRLLILDKLKQFKSGLISGKPGARDGLYSFIEYLIYQYDDGELF